MTKREALIFSFLTDQWQSPRDIALQTKLINYMGEPAVDRVYPHLLSLFKKNLIDCQKTGAKSFWRRSHGTTS